MRRRAWIQMRRRVTRRLIRIQAVWYSDNSFTNFERHWSTLKIKADEKISRQHFFSGLWVNCFSRHWFRRHKGSKVVTDIGACRGYFLVRITRHHSDHACYTYMYMLNLSDVALFKFPWSAIWTCSLLNITITWFRCIVHLNSLAV